MMIGGVITCTCGQLFGFETEQKTINCPTCGKEFIALDYGTEITEEVQTEEPPIEG